MTKKHLRLLDANLNRLREGIRVVEDIFRYIYDDKENASRLKQLRHKARITEESSASQTAFATFDIYKELLDSRDIKNDVLKVSTKSEQNRSDLEAILIANFKRAQESSRALEEFGKLIDSDTSEIFKYIRYELYDLEKVLLTNI